MGSDAASDEDRGEEIGTDVDGRNASSLPQEVGDPMSPTRVLVVDDNLDAVESMISLLAFLGYDARGSFTGKAALLLATIWRPQIVILDLSMPGMDGFEVARRIRVLEGLQDVVLIAWTAYGLASDRERSLRAGFEHHLVKPVDLALLRGTLAAIEVSPV
jgi:CheY-like chemotaxis protein